MATETSSNNVEQITTTDILTKSYDVDVDALTWANEQNESEASGLPENVINMIRNIEKQKLSTTEMQQLAKTLNDTIITINDQKCTIKCTYYPQESWHYGDNEFSSWLLLSVEWKQRKATNGKLYTPIIDFNYTKRDAKYAKANKLSTTDDMQVNMYAKEGYISHQVTFGKSGQDNDIYVNVNKSNLQPFYEAGIVNVGSKFMSTLWH